MPRGGSGKPDDFSPYKTADGRELKLLKSKASSTGYWCVVEKHKGQFYPKRKLDMVVGSKKMKTFGKGKPSAREAAIALAEYTACPYELPVAPPREPMGTKKYKLAADPTSQHEMNKKWRRLAHLRAEANVLLEHFDEDGGAWLIPPSHVAVEP